MPLQPQTASIIFPGKIGSSTDDGKVVSTYQILGISIAENTELQNAILMYNSDYYITSSGLTQIDLITQARCLARISLRI